MSLSSSSTISGAFAVADEDALGHLQGQQSGVGRSRVEHRGHVSDEAGGHELVSRYVDRRSRCPLARVCHRCRSRHACSSTHRPIATILPDCSANGMNTAGEHRPATRVRPAQQRLDAGHASRRRCRRSAGIQGAARRAPAAPGSARASPAWCSARCRLTQVQDGAGCRRHVLWPGTSPRSAAWRTCSGASLPRPLNAMPILAVDRSPPDPTARTVAPSRPRSRAAIASAWEWSSSSSHRITNSSPEDAPACRPAGAPRSSARRRPPTTRRRPGARSVSLTPLNLSRSMKNTAEVLPDRRARRKACSRRSSINTRFGSPVSASCRAASRD